VIKDSDFCLVEGVENGPVEFHKGAIFPKGGRAGGVQPETTGNFGKEVVAVLIGEVACTDLRFHIPTTEGGGWEGDAPDFQAHIGDDGEGHPAEMEGVETGGIGMMDGDLQSFFFWGRKKMRLFSWKRDHDRKEIERSALFGWGPAEFEAEVGKIGLGWVAQNLFFIDAVAGVSAELVVPDARAPTLGVGGRKNGDRGSNGAVVSRVLKVPKAGVVDFLLGSGVSGVKNIQLGPEKSADAANAVSPSQPTAVFEFWKGERVGACLLDGLSDLAKAGTGDRRSLFFGLKESQEGVCRLGKGEGLASTGEAQTFRKCKKGASGHLWSLLLHTSA